MRNSSKYLIPGPKTKGLPWTVAETHYFSEFHSSSTFPSSGNHKLRRRFAPPFPSESLPPETTPPPPFAYRLSAYDVQERVTAPIGFLPRRLAPTRPCQGGAAIKRSGTHNSSGTHNASPSLLFATQAFAKRGIYMFAHWFQSFPGKPEFRWKMPARASPFLFTYFIGFEVGPIPRRRFPAPPAARGSKTLVLEI